MNRDIPFFWWTRANGTTHNWYQQNEDFCTSRDLCDEIMKDLLRTTESDLDFIWEGADGTRSYRRMYQGQAYIYEYSDEGNLIMIVNPACFAVRFMQENDLKETA